MSAAWAAVPVRRVREDQERGCGEGPYGSTVKWFGMHGANRGDDAEASIFTNGAQRVRVSEQESQLYSTTVREIMIESYDLKSGERGASRSTT